MSQIPRFYISGGVPLAEGVLELSEEESRHSSGVLRLRGGDSVELFDGRGRVGAGSIVESGRAGKDPVRVAVESVENLPEQKPHLVIATAIPKGKRWQMLVEKCTELGVSEIQPLVCRYSVVEGQGDPGKWERWAVEAAKQCRRAYLPQIKAPVTLPDFLTRHFEGPCLLASPQGDPMMMWGGQIDRAEDTAFIIGPEAGLTEEEEAACYEASYAPVRFAPHILRIETAAIAACALARGLL